MEDDAFLDRKLRVVAGAFCLEDALSARVLAEVRAIGGFDEALATPLSEFTYACDAEAYYRLEFGGAAWMSVVVESDEWEYVSVRRLGDDARGCTVSSRFVASDARLVRIQGGACNERGCLKPCAVTSKTLPAADVMVTTNLLDGIRVLDACGRAVNKDGADI